MTLQVFQDKILWFCKSMDQNYLYYVFIMRVKWDNVYESNLNYKKQYTILHWYVLPIKFSSVTTLCVGLWQNNQIWSVSLCIYFIFPFFDWTTMQSISTNWWRWNNHLLNKCGYSTSCICQLASYLIYCYRKPHLYTNITISKTFILTCYKSFDCNA